MSRSYKHTPRSGNKKDKFFKRYANRKVRHQLPTDKHSLKGAAYKKVFCQCNICDYETVGISFEQYWKRLVKSWYAWKRDYGYPYPDREKVYQEYCKWFLRK
jgi:hypothetical protein